MRRYLVMLSILMGIVLITGVAYATNTKKTNNKPQVCTICHEESPGHYKRIVLDYDDKGDHFKRDGRPKRDHDSDILYEGEVDCPEPPNDGGGGGGGGCPLPPTPSDLFVDTKVLNDNKVTLTWSPVASGDVVINYSWDKDNLDQSVTTSNDGEHEIDGLTNGIHYWFQMKATNNCGDSGLSIKVDPLP